MFFSNVCLSSYKNRKLLGFFYLICISKTWKARIYPCWIRKGVKISSSSTPRFTGLLYWTWSRNGNCMPTVMRVLLVTKAVLIFLLVCRSVPLAASALLCKRGPAQGGCAWTLSSWCGRCKSNTSVTCHWGEQVDTQPSQVRGFLEKQFHAWWNSNPNTQFWALCLCLDQERSNCWFLLQDLIIPD